MGPTPHRSGPQPPSLGVAQVTIILATALAACNVGSGAADTGAAAASPAGTPVPSVEIPPNATVIELSIPTGGSGRGSSGFDSDGHRVESVNVKAGRPYVFRITNTLTFGHNFFIGDAEDLAAREYDRLTGVHAWSEGVREVVYTFEPNGPPLQFACTLAGHYGRMHADILVEP
jgi:uncharacterized cupredoxin-like copper-binding protein